MGPASTSEQGARQASTPAAASVALARVKAQKLMPLPGASSSAVQLPKKMPVPNTSGLHQRTLDIMAGRVAAYESMLKVGVDADSQLSRLLQKNSSSSGASRPSSRRSSSSRSGSRGDNKVSSSSGRSGLTSALLPNGATKVAESGPSSTSWQSTNTPAKAARPLAASPHHPPQRALLLKQREQQQQQQSQHQQALCSSGVLMGQQAPASQLTGCSCNTRLKGGSPGVSVLCQQCRARQAVQHQQRSRYSSILGDELSSGRGSPEHSAGANSVFLDQLRSSKASSSSNSSSGSSSSSSASSIDSSRSSTSSDIISSTDSNIIAQVSAAMLRRSNTSCSSSSSVSSTVSRSSSCLGRPLQSRASTACKSTTARGAASAAGYTNADPILWLAKLHPAVAACLRKDLMAASKLIKQTNAGAEAAGACAATTQAQPCAGPSSSTGDAGKNGAETCAPTAAAEGAVGPTHSKKPPMSLLLQAPAFPGTNPTAVFSQPPMPASLSNKTHPGVNMPDSQLQQQQQQQQEEDPAAGIYRLQHTKLLVKYAGVANAPVKAVMRHAGLCRTKGDSWTVLWGSPLQTEQLALLAPHQRVNHFPATWELGRKDRMYKGLAAMRRLKGAAFDIVPRFFIMPRDLEEFRSDAQRSPGRMYIQKPVASSRGRGIKMLQDPATVDESLTDVLLQHYIDKPLLVNGHKFDLRVYVAVTCLDPLRVYVYEEGLVRFATEAYHPTKSSLKHKHRRMHLTNYSVNKGCPAALCMPGTDEGGEDEAGPKWSTTALRLHLEEQGVPWEPIWQQVTDIAVKALIAAEPRMGLASKLAVPHRCNCFELFGFDIMLDESLRAWLIEVNTSPALNADTQLDFRIKSAMVADLMHMVGITPTDKEVWEQTQQQERQARLTGLPANTAGSSKAAGPTKGRATSVGGQASSQPVLCARSLQEALALDMRSTSPEQLPEVVRETEAEHRRCRRWQRAFPCPAEPLRYTHLFETPRLNNALVCKYYTDQKRRQQATVVKQ